MAEEELSERPIPRWGYLPGIGLVQVLEYLGDGRFLVLDSEDAKRVARRERISFRRSGRRGRS